jgi:SMC interacting uncharacterized protein involved in chromosome segregation
MSRYQEARAGYTAARERKNAARQSLRHLEDESGPSLEAVNAKQEYARRVAAMIPVRMRAVKDAEKETQKLASAVNEASDNVKEYRNKIDAERSGFEAKKKELQATRSKITNLQADLRNQPVEFNGADWNQKIVSFHYRTFGSNKVV